MAQDIKITPKTSAVTGAGPQILFQGSGTISSGPTGVTGTPASGIELNVMPESDMSFGGYQGELFHISQELQSGTIFSVKDISGLDQISLNASGEIILNKYYGKTYASGAFINSVIVTSGTGATPHTRNLNLDTSNTFSHTLSGTGLTVFTVTNPNIGQRFIVKVAQDAAGGGSGTATWFDTIKWAGGTAPTLTATASKSDMFGFFCSTTSGVGVSGGFDGFVVGQNI